MNPTTNSKETFWVAIGQFSAFAVGLISPMILSRYFTKVDYGTYKQVMYAYNTLLIVFTLGLPRAYAYFIPRVSKAESKDIVRKISKIFIILGIIVSLILYFGASTISRLLKNPDLELALKWFSPTPLFLFPVLGLENILASYRHGKLIAIFSVANRSFILLLSTLPVICFNGTYISAIIGFDLASFFTFLFSFYLKNIPVSNIKREKTDIKYIEIFSFSFPLMLASVWIMIFQSTNQFFISRYFGSAEFAEYSNGFTELPLVPMIVNSISIVITPIFSNLVHTNIQEIENIWLSALSKAVKLVYPITICSIVLSENIMVCLYGEQYVDSGIFFAIKNIECFFLVIPFFPILMALNKNKAYANVHLIFAIIIIPLEYIVVKVGGGAYMVVSVYVLCAILKVFAQFLLVHRYIDIPLISLFPYKTLIKVFSIGSLVGIIVFFIKKYIFINNSWMVLSLSGGIYICIYWILSIIFKIQYNDIFVGIIGSRFKSIFKVIP